MQLPPWIKQRAPAPGVLEQMKNMLDSLGLNTVCESAHCPNLGECFAKGTATVMIMGDRCTRSCGFCAVGKGLPHPPDPNEPANVAAMVNKLDLKHVVITSVTRDDLEDGGALQFAETVKAVKQKNAAVTVEVLIPDFKGSCASLEKVVETKPDIVNHNLETVPRLYQKVRPQAQYARSLSLLGKVKKLDAAIYTKSGIMVGLGETTGEVIALMEDLRGVGCDILTIGQYLRPSPLHLEIEDFIKPEIFGEYKTVAGKLGFKYVASSPLVRSSYNASDFFRTN
ncbi:MAG: lipoyl synthase [Dethiobacter sp.]|jgi:lipoic acid synthetase|nr:lipoyl synthase [Dethiobacter sp.]